MCKKSLGVWKTKKLGYNLRRRLLSSSRGCRISVDEESGRRQARASGIVSLQRAASLHCGLRLMLVSWNNMARP